MIENEVLVIGDTISAHVCAALLAKKGFNVGWVINNEQKNYEFLLWLGPKKIFEELSEVLGLNSKLRKCNALYVNKEYRTYRLPISNFQILAFRYFAFPAKLRIISEFFKLKSKKPEEFSYYTGKDAFDKLNFDYDTSTYFLALASFVTAMPWAGIDAITLFSTAIALRHYYPQLYSIHPSIGHFLSQLREIFRENGGIIYQGPCIGLELNRESCSKAMLPSQSLKAKFFVLSPEAHMLHQMLSQLNHQLLKEFAKQKAKCLEVKVILKEKASFPNPVVFVDYPLLGFVPPNSLLEGGRQKTFWRYVVGNASAEPGRRFRYILARAYPNFWSNVEAVEERLVEQGLPYYKKLPLCLLKNLVIGTKNVYGNGLRDEVRAGIEAFKCCRRFLRTP